MRLPVLDARGGGRVLEKRDSKNNKALVVVAVIVIAIFVILVITYLVTLKFRNKTRASASSSRSPNGKLPSLFSWQNWRKRPRRNDYSTSLQDNELDRSSTRDREMSGALDPERQSVNANGVDRNTSVRSVMTLPAYSPAARENERILGREGERGGIDTVVEFPETQDDEEARREDEMESLYQIRLARRAEAREREERRQARREARERGDMEALAEIRRRAEAAAEESISQVLIAEHQSTNRDRRVSSVQYGDLGLARHDGTRLRANSSESDNRPLLDSAASISGQSQRSRGLSNNTLHSHYRGPSASSVLSISTRASDEFEFPDPVHRSRSNDTATDDFEVVSLSHPRSRSASRVATPIPAPSIEVPHEDAPAYEDPPNYESPVRTRAPQLPSLERLPSIQVTTELTPVDGRGSSGNSPLSR
ncbi:uncharacterized protein BDR25DRAFT_65990 [Lindgomyces ingoldianus]|uniref:Uncharacterized protein n=1 Tax=Lindgomyces ingoldianus TaxID=673940 RepID=A0ACB6RD77_9PLEO|nr:uncharacterized protein BDR25DRAFT_65990 [Lindgomyces ingoldianus]KAF2476436.1 hypothetical protein BDR25DRAFT_65990 [Lindgomyces ingoldianus]